MNDFTIPQAERIGHLLVCEPHPAGIEAQRLRQQDKLLAIVTDLLLPFLPFRGGHDQIIPDARELDVGGDEQAVEGLGFIEYELDIQPAGRIIARDGVFERCYFGGFDGLVRVSAHRVTESDGF